MQRSISLGSLISCKITSQSQAAHIRHVALEWDSENFHRYTELQQIDADVILIDFAEEAIDVEKDFDCIDWGERLKSLKNIFNLHKLPSPTLLDITFIEKSENNFSNNNYIVDSFNHNYQRLRVLFHEIFHSNKEPLSVSIGIDSDTRSLGSSSIKMLDEKLLTGFMKRISCCGTVGISHAMTEGTHRVSLGVDRSILIHTSGNIQSGTSFLVCFNGNDTKRRTKKTGPFFTGRRIAEDTDLPLISFSDPSLDLSRDISIGWYIGNSSFPLYQHYVARVIDSISIESNSTPVLFGGSGGGFSTLVQSSLTCVPTRALVWNALTQLMTSQSVFVEPYKNLALLGLEQESEFTSNAFISAVTGYGIVSEIFMADIPDDSKIVYLQNRSDLRYHTNGLYHFISKTKTRQYNQSIRSVASPAGNIQTWTGDWGVGHVAPDRELILRLLNHLFTNKTIDYLINEAIMPSKNTMTPTDTSILVDDTNIDISYQRDTDHIQAKILLSDHRKFEFVDMEYAFYLIADSKVIASEMYTSASVVSFPISRNANYVIRGFVKDFTGKIINSFQNVI